MFLQWTVEQLLFSTKWNASSNGWVVVVISTFTSQNTLKIYVVLPNRYWNQLKQNRSVVIWPDLNHRCPDLCHVTGGFTYLQVFQWEGSTVFREGVGRAGVIQHQRPADRITTAAIRLSADVTTSFPEYLQQVHTSAKIITLKNVSILHCVFWVLVVLELQYIVHVKRSFVVVLALNHVFQQKKAAIFVIVQVMLALNCVIFVLKY